LTGVFDGKQGAEMFPQIFASVTDITGCPTKVYFRTVLAIVLGIPVL
jgi:hypothetical protein